VRDIQPGNTLVIDSAKIAPTVRSRPTLYPPPSPPPPSADEALEDCKKDKAEAAAKTRLAVLIDVTNRSALLNSGTEGVASSNNPKSLFLRSMT
jgi:hypothetical protein